MVKLFDFFKNLVCDSKADTLVLYSVVVLG
jgi:hypothetical protein